MNHWMIASWELPVIATLPVLHGWAATHSTTSYPSSAPWVPHQRMSPSE